MAMARDPTRSGIAHTERCGDCVCDGHIHVSAHAVRRTFVNRTGPVLLTTAHPVRWRLSAWPRAAPTASRVTQRVDRLRHSVGRLESAGQRFPSMLQRQARCSRSIFPRVSRRYCSCIHLPQLFTKLASPPACKVSKFSLRSIVHIQTQFNATQLPFTRMTLPSRACAPGDPL